MVSTALEEAPYESSYPDVSNVVPQEIPCRNSVAVSGDAESQIALEDRGRVNLLTTSPKYGPALGLGEGSSRLNPRAILIPALVARAANLSTPRSSRAFGKSRHEYSPRIAR